MVQLLTPAEVAEILKISTSTLYKLAATRRVPSVKVGGSLRFDPRAVEAWLAERTREALPS